jgi:DNA-binding response OmpR family regulator
MKPFSPRELVLRVRSIFRRMKQQPGEVLRAEGIQVYPERRQCFVSGRLVTLTAKEFDLLYELILARGNVLTRKGLMDKVWGYHGEATSRTLDTHVRRLREKLGESGAVVETVRGVGYRMAIPAENEAR